MSRFLDRFFYIIGLLMLLIMLNIFLRSVILLRIILGWLFFLRLIRRIIWFIIIFFFCFITWLIALTSALTNTTNFISTTFLSIFFVWRIWWWCWRIHLRKSNLFLLWPLFKDFQIWLSFFLLILLVLLFLIKHNLI